MSEFLTPADVAARWACSPGHVRRLCRRGELRALRLGSDWRISQEAVETYEHSHTTDATNDVALRQTASQTKEVHPSVTAVAGYELPADYEPVFPDLWGGSAPTKKPALTSQ